MLRGYHFTVKALSHCSASFASINFAIDSFNKKTDVMKRNITRIVFAVFVMMMVSLAAPASGVVPNTANPTETVAAKDALKTFKSLNRKERKSRLRDARRVWKEYRADKKAGKATDDRMVLLVILCILLPPLAVYLKEDEINTKFWISLVLTLLFWIPGVVYALLVVFDEV